MLTISYAAFGGFLFMMVENRAIQTNPTSGRYYNDKYNGRGFVVSVEPAEAVSSTNFTTAAVFSSRNSSVLRLKASSPEIDKARLATVKKLWQITEQMNILYPENWTRIAAEELAAFQAEMVQVLAKEWAAAAGQGYMPRSVVKTQKTIPRNVDERTRPTAKVQIQSYSKDTRPRYTL